MRSHYERLVRVALVYGSLCFLSFWGLCALGWFLFPAEPNDDEVRRLMRWGAHMVGEKVVGLVLMSATALLASRVHHPSWKWGVATGIAAAVAYQLIAVFAYMGRFGFTAWQEYNSLWRTVLSALAGRVID